MHADDEANLIRDAEQDCEGFYFDIETQSIVFERFFDTCDDDDYVIEVQCIIYLMKNTF